jgi:hypothetical protein
MWKWLVVLAVLLGGCATPVKQFVVESPDRFAEAGSEYENDATVYVFRENNFAGGAWAVEVLVDGVSRATLRTKTYASFPVTPGSRQIKFHWQSMIGSKNPDIAILADLSASKTYYFTFGAGADINLSSDSTFSTMVQQLGKQGAETRKATFEKRSAQ